MIEERDLDAAVNAGILDAATRERLVVFTRDLHRGAAGPDEEQFRLLTGFNDIFVSIAIGLLLFAVSTLTAKVALVLGSISVAGLSWALAEYFTRRRRMALPSIILLLAFVGAVYVTAQVMFSGNGVMTAATKSAAIPVGALLTVAAAYLHWRHFMVPITVAAGAAALSLSITLVLGGLLSATSGQGEAVLLPLIALCGIAVFALAMWFDSRDLARVTRRTDVAFWLHLLAAPMIIHPIFSATGLLNGTPAPGAAVIVVLVYLVLTVLALAIDRRALLVSALSYVIYAVRTLVDRGDGISAGFGVTALIIGLFLVVLSAGWRPVRAMVLKYVPLSLSNRLPQAS